MWCIAVIQPTAINSKKAKILVYLCIDLMKLCRLITFTEGIVILVIDVHLTTFTKVKGYTKSQLKEVQSNKAKIKGSDKNKQI